MQMFCVYSTYCRQAYSIDNAHGQLVRDLDFNPNRQYYLASCGDDCLAKFWDVRNVVEPVKVLSDHSHWSVLAFFTTSRQFFFRTAVQLKILIAINCVIKIFNRDQSHQNKKHKFVAQNRSIIHNITSIARCKSQQSLVTTEIKIRTSN